MSAELFIEKLENTGLLEEQTIAKLRAHLARPGKTPTAKTLAKFLVSKGQLTEPQAKKLLSELKESAGPPLGTSKSPSGAATKPGKSPDYLDQIGEVDENETLDEIEEIQEVPAATEQIDEIEEIEEIDEIEEIQDVATPIEMIEVLPAGPESIQAMDLLSEPFDAPPQGNAVEAVYEEEAETKAKTFKGKVTMEKRGWKSIWILVLPTVLVIGLLSSVLLVLLLTRQTNDQLWELAEDAYNNQNYASAIELHEKFSKYKSDSRSKISACRVPMSKIRVPLEQKNWELTLEKFDAELPALPDQIGEIVDTSEQENIRAELAGLIPRCANGFLDVAEKAASVDEAKRLLDLADKTTALINDGRYMPKSEREKPINQKAIADLTERMAKVRRRVEREDRLLATLATIEQRGAAGDTPAAAQAYDDLLRIYPELRSEQRLLDAVRVLSKKHQELIKVSQESLPVSIEDVRRESQVVLMSTHVGNAIPAFRGDVLPLLIQGSIYGIDVGQGNLLWRHFVGYETTIAPQWFDAGDRRIIAADQHNHNLLALKPTDGSLAWRVEIGEPFMDPLIFDDLIFVTTHQGRMIMVDGVDGSTSRVATIPQLFDIGPVAYTAGPKRILQVGDQTNLYVMSTSDLSCREVLYLGHQRGAIEVPPVVLAGHILIAENKANNVCELRVYKSDKDGLLQPAQTAEILKGHVRSNMVLYGRRALVVTNSGDIRLYEIDLSSTDRPLKQIAKTQLAVDSSLHTWFLPQEGLLWVADRGLTRFDIQTQKGELARQHVTDKKDIFIGPMSFYSDYNALVHVRRRRGSGLISVTAVDGEKHEQIWRIDMAAPLAGAPFIDGKSQQLTVANSQGDLFALTDEVIVAGMNSEPAQRASTAEQDLNFPYQVSLGADRYAFIGDAEQKRYLFYNPAAPRRPLEMVPLSGTEYELACPPISFAGGALIASRTGMIQLINPEITDLPPRFLPPTGQNPQFHWQRPYVIDNEHFVIAHRDGVIYNIGLQNNKSLSETSKATYAGKFVRPLTVIGGRAMTVAATDNRQQNLVSFGLPRLDTPTELALPAAAVFGPFAITDSRAIVSLENGKVACFEASTAEAWVIDIGNTVVTGAVVDGRKVALILLDGRILWVNADDGSKVGEVLMGEPTVIDATFPFVHEGKLYVSVADGTMHISVIP
jgi:outer membrane protein assembly factor BamB/polyhydroxyalkanoate synthesis regulator phasin